MSGEFQPLTELLSASTSIVVLTGAGVSTASGIPAYRDRDGVWMNAKPIQHSEFLGDPDFRRRYWSRSYMGWRRFDEAAPNAAHHALAELEARGSVDLLITQNVDGLHTRAGSRRVVELHGNLARVRCHDCETQIDRPAWQDSMKRANPDWHARVFAYRPDGDAEIAAESWTSFEVPPCEVCGGVLKPDVVMFGGAVPRPRVDQCLDAVRQADLLLVVGSSLAVFSGFRFARLADERGIPIAIVNQGRTRADELATVKIDADCRDVLTHVASHGGSADQPDVLADSA